MTKIDMCSFLTRVIAAAEIIEDARPADLTIPRVIPAIGRIAKSAEIPLKQKCMCGTAQRS